MHSIHNNLTGAAPLSVRSSHCEVSLQYFKRYPSTPETSILKDPGPSDKQPQELPAGEETHFSSRESLGHIGKFTFGLGLHLGHVRKTRSPREVPGKSQAVPAHPLPPPAIKDFLHKDGAVGGPGRLGISHGLSIFRPGNFCKGHERVRERVVSFLFHLSQSRGVGERDKTQGKTDTQKERV